MALAAVERGGDRMEALRSHKAAGAWGADYERIARPHPPDGGWGTPK